MKAREMAKEFYQRNRQSHAAAMQFDVHRIEEYKPDVSNPINRKDFYKITLLLQGHGALIYANKVIPINNIAMVFTNPMIPFSYDSASGGEKGYFCLFTEEFINDQLKSNCISKSPLFTVGGNPVLFPDEPSLYVIRNAFESMLTENASCYVNKHDLLRNFIQIIIHESLKIDPPLNYVKTTASAERLTSLFLELLTKQFPIPSPEHTLRFKTATEFADQLSIHCNHLNRVLKKTTNSTTSEHISQRIIKEAETLLLQTDWDIAQIGYCLGYDHAPNFYSFFKKQTGSTASQFRKQHVANS
jgi:AraC family transcriptional activator of pobA